MTNVRLLNPHVETTRGLSTYVLDDKHLIRTISNFGSLGKIKSVFHEVLADVSLVKGQQVPPVRAFAFTCDSPFVDTAANTPEGRAAVLLDTLSDFSQKLTRRVLGSIFTYNFVHDSTVSVTSTLPCNEQLDIEYAQDSGHLSFLANIWSYSSANVCPTHRMNNKIEIRVHQQGEDQESFATLNGDQKELFDQIVEDNGIPMFMEITNIETKEVLATSLIDGMLFYQAGNKSPFVWHVLNEFLDDINARTAFFTI
jgi:hypothetical protein